MNFDLHKLWSVVKDVFYESFVVLLIFLVFLLIFKIFLYFYRICMLGNRQM